MKLLVLKSKTNDLVLLGKIESINDDRSTLFEVLNGEIEILIPMIDHFCQNWPWNKKVIMDLPEGLSRCLVEKYIDYLFIRLLLKNLNKQITLSFHVQIFL
jgi:hypothetical protein